MSKEGWCARYSVFIDAKKGGGVLAQTHQRKIENPLAQGRLLPMEGQILIPTAWELNA